MSYLRLEYPSASYKELDKGYPFRFEYSDQAIVIPRSGGEMDIKYPRLKATLMLTYNSVQNDLRLLLADSEKLTFKHVIKADDIQAIPYESYQKKVYGKMFEVYGNAATQIQFHATDSTDNFITGALYFYAKPNFDSILPAVNYLKRDVIHLMETLSWEK